MRCNKVFTVLALLLGLAGCLPTSDGETASFLGGSVADFSTCSEVALCADTNSADSCISRATSSAGSEFSTVDQCYLACNDDEACENDCLPLVSSCYCGDQALFLDGTCTDPSRVPWRVYLASFNVAQWCGIDGFNSDEFFYRAYLDGELVRDSSESDCYDDGRARWPPTEAWPYATSQVFSMNIIENDFFDNDEYVTGYGWQDEQGNLAPIPASLLIAGFWGEGQFAGEMEIGITR
jgi:hypothetical protein